MRSALETFLRDFALLHPLKIGEINVEKFRRKNLLDIAEDYEIIDSNTRKKCEQIFSIRDGHAHYHLGLWEKTFKKLDSSEITEVHSVELSQLVLKDTYDIFEEIFSQLRKKTELAIILQSSY